MTKQTYCLNSGRSLFLFISGQALTQQINTSYLFPTCPLGCNNVSYCQQQTNNINQSKTSDTYPYLQQTISGSQPHIKNTLFYFSLYWIAFASSCWCITAVVIGSLGLPFNCHWLASGLQQAVLPSYWLIEKVAACQSTIQQKVVQRSHFWLHSLTVFPPWSQSVCCLHVMFPLIR